jgi:hypothetical protein
MCNNTKQVMTDVVASFRLGCAPGWLVRTLARQGTLQLLASVAAAGLDVWVRERIRLVGEPLGLR